MSPSESPLRNSSDSEEKRRKRHKRGNSSSNDSSDNEDKETAHWNSRGKHREEEDEDISLLGAAKRLMHSRGASEIIQMIREGACPPMLKHMMGRVSLVTRFVVFWCAKTIYQHINKREV